MQARDNSQRYFYWYTFLMVFPTILLLFNVSVYLFIFVWQSFKDKYKFNLSLKPVESKIILFFLIGTTVSLFDIWTLNQGWDRVELGLRVLPNYIYWTVLLIFLIRHFQHIDLSLVTKATFFGMVLTLLYFFVPIFRYLDKLDIFKGLPQNAVSFLMLSYVPLALVFVRKNFGMTAFVLAGVIFSALALQTGSRSGAILVTAGCLMMLIYFSKSNLVWSMLLLAAVFVIVATTAKQSLEAAIQKLTPRTHTLIYDRDRVLSSDPSYLSRVAILRKGAAIFEESRWTGVGINNFTQYKTDISYNFAGGDLIEHDDKYIQRASAHNSYLSILAETGLLGFIPFILFLLLITFKLLRNLIRVGFDPIGAALLTGLTCMLVHLYFISAILNVFTWFFFGLVCVYNYQCMIKTAIKDRAKQQRIPHLIH
jgi:O-antigen ligase